MIGALIFFIAIAVLMIVLALYTASEKDVVYTLIFCAIGLLSLVGSHMISYQLGLPHYGCEPDFSDVQEGTAKVDTVYHICGNDTIKETFVLSWID